MYALAFRRERAPRYDPSRAPEFGYWVSIAGGHNFDGAAARCAPDEGFPDVDCAIRARARARWRKTALSEANWISRGARRILTACVVDGDVGDADAWFSCGLGDRWWEFMGDLFVSNASTLLPNRGWEVFMTFNLRIQMRGIILRTLY